MTNVKIILKNPCTTVGEHNSSAFSMSTILSFKIIGNKHCVYEGKDCMKTFCESLRDHRNKVINFKKKKIKL